MQGAVRSAAGWQGHVAPRPRTAVLRVPTGAWGASVQRLLTVMLTRTLLSRSRAAVCTPSMVPGSLTTTCAGSMPAHQVGARGQSGAFSAGPRGGQQQTLHATHAPARSKAVLLICATEDPQACRWISLAPRSNA